MKPSLSKHLIIMSALSATLSLSACGDKKNVSIGSKPAPAESLKDSKSTEKTAPKVEDSKKAETVDTKKTDKKTNVDDIIAVDNLWPDDEFGANLPDPTNPNASMPKPKSEAKKEEPKTSSPVAGIGEQKGSDLVEPVPMKPQPTSPGIDYQKPVDTYGAKTPSGYVYNDPKNVLDEKYPKKLTGAATRTGLVYTTSATDDLVDILRARNDRASYENQRLNYEAAASVDSAKIALSANGRDLVLTVRIHENGLAATYNLVGPKNGSLSKVRRANGEVTSGSRSIEATSRCMDADGGCQVVFTRIKIGESPNAGIINIIFRNTNADLYFKLPGTNSGNPDYLKFREMTYNTIQKNFSLNRVKQLRFASFEVVNGKSGFAVMMKTYHKELMAFSGSLLAPDYGTRLNLKLNKGGSTRDDMLDTVLTADSSYRYSNNISEAALIGNNGLGQVELEFTMAAKSGYYPDKFSIVFMRAPKALRSLE